MMLIPGKSIKKKYCTVDLIFSVGVLDNDTWIPMQFKNTVFVTLNNDPIFYGQAQAGGTVVTSTVEDINTSSNLNLKIYLENIDNLHHVPPMIRIEKFNLEGLNLKNIFELIGNGQLDENPVAPSEYIGQIGWYELTIQTPIYRWLLNNFKKFNIYE